MSVKSKFFLFVFCVFAALFGGYCVAYINTETTIEIKVTDKEVKVSESSSDYLIFTDGEVFQNSDSFIYWKFNSSDFQGEFHVDSSYRVVVVGWRIPFLSMYRNIVEIKN